jgi:anaerobic C4-dicarboxylate transporter
MRWCLLIVFLFIFVYVELCAVLMMSIVTNECYSIFQNDINYNYKIDAKVELIKDVQQNSEEKSSQWSLNALLSIQRIDNNTIGMQVKNV